MASYNGVAVAVTVNLVTGTASGGDAQGDTFSGIENVRGTAQGDTLIGDDADNLLLASAGNDELTGNGGDDALHGGAGADVMDGGEGSDFVAYTGSPAGVTVNIASQSASGGDAAGDSITGIENVTGSDVNDTLTGDNEPNTFAPNAGNDLVDGAGGGDTVSYGTRLEDWNINLSTGTATAPSIGATDTLISIENAKGGLGNDTLTGTSGPNTLTGGPGSDAIDGLGGSDEVNYRSRTDPFTINLATGVATSAATGEIDSLANIEDVVGSLAGDSITGDAGNNVIDGGPGGDAMDGGAGIDTLAYSFAPAGVSINLATGAGSAGEGSKRNSWCSPMW